MRLLTYKPPLTGRGKSGGDSRTPVEHANDLFSTARAKVIDLVSEGEVVGCKDTVNIEKSIYFDDVVLMNSDGSLNFDGVTVQQRVGTPLQEPVDGFDEVESSVSINQEVTDVSSPQWTVSDTDIDAVRVIIRLPALYMQNTSNGDLLRHTVGLKIEIKEDNEGSFTEVINDTITGKANSPYQRAYRINLKGYDDAADWPLTFKVTRTTTESEATTTQDQIFVDSYVELQEARLRYPDSAYLAVEVDAELFGGRIPRRSFLYQGIKIQIPSNYNPTTRVYTGLWDGTFTEGWTNNPAWILYDILTNNRYGLGDDIDVSQVDTAALYSIGQYCDELVDDGKGSTEPRFTINTTINERKEAFTVVNAIVSAFRGMAFWSAGGVTFDNDRPKDARRIVAPENVMRGVFNYSGIALKGRHSAVLVTWNDPDDFYKQQVEVIEDTELIERFGFRTIEVVAFGTTSRAQAIRFGKWILDSEKSETETVVFTAGWDHADARPGEIIKISDPTRAGARFSGRIMATNVKDLKPATVTRTFAKQSTFTCVTDGSEGVDRNSHGTFHCTIYIPSSKKPLGTIMDAGTNTASGMWLGFDDDGDLILRAGDGSASPGVNDYARLVIPTEKIDRDRELDLLFDIRPDPGRVRLWINNQYMGEDGTDDGSAFLGSEWADSNDGGYGTVGGGSTVLGESGTYTQDVIDSGVELRSVLTYYREDYVFTPIYNHTAKESFAPGATVTSSTGDTAGSMDRNNQALFWCAFKTPAAGTLPEGCIFELGKGPTDAFEAFYMGFDGNGDFVVHAGAGGATPDINEHARIVVPAEFWEADTTYHVTINIIPLEGLLGLWINHKFREFAQTEDLTAFQNSQWAQGESGNYGSVNGETIIDLTGGFDDPFNGTLVSSLDYNRNGRLTEANNGHHYGSVDLDESVTVQPGDQLAVQVADDHIDVLDLWAGTTSTTVNVVDHPRKTIALNAMYILKGAVDPEEWRILNSREVDIHQYEITALRYDRTKFDRVEQDIVATVPVTSLLPTGPLLPPTNLTVNESLYKVNNSVNTRLTIGWSHSTDPRVRVYRVEVRPPDQNWKTVEYTPLNTADYTPAEAGNWDFRITSLSDPSNAGHSTAKLELLSQAIAGKTAPPADVTNFSASRGYASVTLSWDEVTDLDLIGYRIKRGDSWESGTVVESLLLAQEKFISLDTTDNVTFWIKAIDELQTESVNAVSLATSIKALPTITNFSAVQLGSDIKFRWDSIVSPEVVQYELRKGGVGDNWNQSFVLARGTDSYHTSTVSVAASTTFRFALKPYVELENGSRSYGPEVTFTHEQHPVIGGNIIKTQNEHTAWTGGRVIEPTRTPDEDIAEGTTLNSAFAYVSGGSPPNIGRSQNATFAVDLQVDSTGGTPTGAIIELGNSFQGGLLAFDGNGDIVFRAGDGAASWDVNDIARVVVPNANIPLDVDFTVLCDIRCDGTNSGRVRIWIDGVSEGTDETNDSSSFSTWSSTNDGKYKGNNGSYVSGEAGAYYQDPELTSVTLQSNLRYWANELVNDSLEVTGSNELALKAGETTGTYTYRFSHASQKFGRLFHAFTALWLSDTALSINDATMEINDADFPITPDLNDDTIPQIELVIYRVDGTVVSLPFDEELDLQFTDVDIRVNFNRRTTDDNRPALSALTTYFDEPSEMR